MAWDESKHPRADDGKFTNGTGAPRTFRQNASYREILNSSHYDTAQADFDNKVAELLCDAFGIERGGGAAERVLAFLNDRNREGVIREKEQENAPKKMLPTDFPPLIESDTVRPTINPNVKISADHYSRLCTMWSDYNLGTCKPVEKNGVKFFNVDNTIYRTVGDYPYFHISNKIPFRDTFKLEQFLKELDDDDKQ